MKTSDDFPTIAPPVLASPAQALYAGDGVFVLVTQEPAGRLHVQRLRVDWSGHCSLDDLAATLAGRLR